MVSVHAGNVTAWPIGAATPLILTWPASVAPLVASRAVTVTVLLLSVRAPVRDSTTGGAGGGATEVRTVAVRGQETSARSCRNRAESPAWMVGDDPTTTFTNT